MITTSLTTALSAQVPGFTPGPGWNIVADVQDMLSFAFMRNAFAAGTASAIVAGLIGYFVVLRESSFAAHAISHIGFAGAAGAVLLGLSPVLGVAVLSLVASGAMGMLGKRLRGRDVVIGLIMAASLGLGYLFISLYTGNAQNAYSILFGQIFGITTGAVLITVVTSVIVLAILAAIFRPLLFASLDEEVAQARGIRVRALGIGFMLLMALAVSEAVQVSGVLLIFALLVAPGAIAERVARRPGAALAVSGGLAVLITWISLALAYYTPVPGQLLRDQPGLRSVPRRPGLDRVGQAARARAAGAAVAPAPPGRDAGRGDCYGADVSTPAKPAWGRGTRVRGTRQAEALASVLDSLPGFWSAQQIHDELRRRGERIGLTTVYRHLQVLSEDGRVDTIRHASGETLYRRCRSEAHHHHLICRVCGASVEVEGRAVEQWAAKVAAEAGFTAVDHTVELFGLCPRCSTA